MKAEAAHYRSKRLARNLDLAAAVLFMLLAVSVPVACRLAT